MMKDMHKEVPAEVLAEAKEHYPNTPPSIIFGIEWERHLEMSEVIAAAFATFTNNMMKDGLKAALSSDDMTQEEVDGIERKNRRQVWEDIKPHLNTPEEFTYAGWAMSKTFKKAEEMLTAPDSLMGMLGKLADI